ncbi:hypothetical protein D9757_006108 [Collybiopsis confluens]|uniref:Uncharacterized protein n=1 Tax=Collybiopsis confluens TaxID=2823264 RepID=A0A8H5M791_9AGAR|nr:hypothetical protein D9757_006108 [Collybiopsis confluens]
MVSSVPFDILAAPQAEIQRVFEIHIQSQSSEEFSTVIGNHFKEIFGKDERLDLIPHLNSNQLANNSGKNTDLKLVQFRAMVQDTSASPEMYLSHLREGRYGGWGAHDTMNGPIEYSNLRECTRFWAVSIPGETTWARKVLSKNESGVSSSNDSQKSPYKYPLPSTPHVGAQVVVYLPNLELKSTDTVTFVGLFESERDILHVLYHEKAVTHPYQTYPLDIIKRTSEDSVQSLRSELISWIADEALAGDQDAAEWVLLSVISRVQSRTPPIIPTSLTLSHFPSRSQAATSSSLESPSNVFAAAAVSSNDTPALYHVLSQLVPIITYASLSLPLLNDGAFIPESKPQPRSGDSDEDTEDELHSGILQLAPSTVCLITDSGVTEGRINERGVRNLRALQEVIQNQTLEYVFPYSGFRFETDIGCVVCTEGRKSAMVETHITVPLKPAKPDEGEEDFRRKLYKNSAEIHLPSTEKLEMWRKLIGGAMTKQAISSTDPSSASTPVGGIGVSDAAAALIQEEFVKGRKDAAKENKERKKETELGKGITTPNDLIHHAVIDEIIGSLSA